MATLRDRPQRVPVRRRKGLAASLGGVAVAALAVVLLVAVRIAPFLASHPEFDGVRSGAASQPCC
jgi:hypothetical protein